MRDPSMNDGDVETLSKRGQWVNRVIGGEEMSASFASRDEALEAGRTLALQFGTQHVVRDAEETGVVTDESRDVGASSEQAFDAGSGDQPA